jgi:ectoine hydroxylase-related dioxygenase (phytanoyl-CoA dioxygenase family)
MPAQREFAATPTEDTGARRLTDTERDTLCEALNRDGYVVMPEKLPAKTIAMCLSAIDRIASLKRGDNASVSVKVQNCVDADPAFRRLMMHEPALQLAYDAFGPMFHLNQSNFVSRPRDNRTLDDFVSSSPWHADGPRPGLFPRVGGAMGLHYLKFGYFLTDLTHGNGGPLMVVRGSHTRPELDNLGSNFRIEDYADDLVTFNCEVGTVVAFHQAQWHAAPPNHSDVERKNVYISYCPTWMRPLDRELPVEGELAGMTAEERWLLGEHRPALRWWIPNEQDLTRMARFRRGSEAADPRVVRYD